MTRWIGMVAAIATLAVGLVAIERPRSADALTGADWQAGNIISDSLFYDSDAMTQAQIQSFLSSMIGGCRNGQCLDVLSYTVAARAQQTSSVTGRVICTALPGGTMTAAAIIYNAQVSCGISAKVILVTLQKEQSLITGSIAKAPGQKALDRAMGMACPDTAPCAAYALGFGNQVYEAARQLKVYKAGRFGRQPGVQSIRYSPTATCGSSVVNVQNYATAALYNYTPYQPNSTVLANLYGAGDDCGAYGNKNFWLYYTTWFGSTQGAPGPDLAPGVFARTSDGRLVAYYGTGKGNWQSPVTLGTGWGGMTAIVGAGDQDGDGHRDILARDSSGVLWRYPFTDDGTLGTPVQISTGWNSQNLIIGGVDFNDDGIMDVISRDTAGYLWLWTGSGRGGLRPPVRIGNGWSSFTSITAVPDFTGDGRADLLARDAAGTLWVYPGTGSGYLGAPTQVGTGWNGMTSIASIGNFDGDALPDIVARDASGGLWLYSGNGRGGFWRGIPIGQGWSGFDTIVGVGAPIGRLFAESDGVGDLDADGAADLMAVSGGTASIYRGNGRGGWAGSVRIPGDWSSIDWYQGDGDLDGDGIPDVIARDTSGNLWLYPGTGQGANPFGARRLVGSGWRDYTIIGAGDLTDDGIPDLLARDAQGVLWLYPGVLGGGFGNRTQVGNGWNTMTSIVNPGDFDGDGNADLLATDSSGVLWLYSGNGNGGWFAPTQIGVGWGAMTDIVGVGDFTGDRNPDLIARDSAGRLWLFAGDGAGGFSAVRQIGVGWGGFRVIG